MVPGTKGNSICRALRRNTACSKELSLMVFSVSNIVEDRTCEGGWFASGPARGRVKLVDQPTSNNWTKYIPPIQCIPPRAMHNTHPAPFSFTKAYFEASAAIVLFPPPTRKQVCYISRFLAWAVSNGGNENGCRLVSAPMSDPRMVNP